MVLDLESVVQGTAARACHVTHQPIEQGVPIDLHHAFRAVSIDVISDFGFNKSYDFLKKPDFGAHFFGMVRGLRPALWAFQQLPSLQALALKIPPWLAPYLSEPLGHVTAMQMECLKQVEGVKKQMENGSRKKRHTIFSTLLTNDTTSSMTTWCQVAGS